MSGKKIILKAIYSFKGSHNDELNFKKGDLITLTQKEEGDWWEGTLDGKTGWFPSNYVKEVPESKQKSQQDVKKSKENNELARSNSEEVRMKQIDYRQQIIRDLLEKEKEFVEDLMKLHKNYLNPLHNSEMLRENEYRQLAGNTDELIQIHSSMNLDIEDVLRQSPRDQKLGKVFLKHGSSVRNAHQTYWGNHPKAVCVLERFREKLDAFMEAQGSESPGLMVLTTALSKPFRHLEKYPAVALELEKHLEDDHPDRGDTQRSIGFFKSVASECAKLRRQKELELEVLTGTIRDWEGDPISTLGEVVHMGSVAVGQEHKDRYFILFHTHLLMLSVSLRMSTFIYEGKLPLSGIAINRLEDSDGIINSFEITGPMIERILVVCQSKPDSLKWVEILQQEIKSTRQQNSFNSHPKFVNNSPSTQVKRPHNVGAKGYLWKMSCLRPAPPTRSFITNNEDKKKKKDPDTTYEEDMQILRVIEAYCTSNKRHTQTNSTLIEKSPMMLVADEKLITNQQKHESSNGSLDQDKNVMDTVYGIRDKISLLSQQNKEVLRMLEDEIAARKRLENFVKSHLKINQE